MTTVSFNGKKLSFDGKETMTDKKSRKIPTRKIVIPEQIIPEKILEIPEYHLRVYERDKVIDKVTEPVYKFLTKDGHPGRNGDPAFQWPLPTLNADGTWTPGDWCEAPNDRTIELCSVGLHASPAAQLDKWTSNGTDLFEVEYDGYVVADANKMAGRRARLVRHFPDWAEASKHQIRSERTYIDDWDLRIPMPVFVKIVHTWAKKHLNNSDVDAPALLQIKDFSTQALIREQAAKATTSDAVQDAKIKLAEDVVNKLKGGPGLTKSELAILKAQTVKRAIHAELFTNTLRNAASMEYGSIINGYYASYSSNFTWRNPDPTTAVQIINRMSTKTKKVANVVPWDLPAEIVSRFRINPRIATKEKEAVKTATTTKRPRGRVGNNR